VTGTPIGRTSFVATAEREAQNISTRGGGLL
jgi:hypothetical protein